MKHIPSKKNVSRTIFTVSAQVASRTVQFILPGIGTRLLIHGCTG